MAESRSIEVDYGGPYADARAVTNPDTDRSADYMNRESEDVCHLTRTARKATIVFTTRNSNGDCTILSFRSQWGSTVTTETVQRTATGTYTATLKTSYTDDLDTSETVSLYDAEASVRSTDPVDNVFARVLSISGNVVTFTIESPKGTLADYGDNSAAALTGVIRMW